MPRIARIVYAGYPHHIVQRGNNKQRIFLENQDREVYLDLLKKFSIECGCKIHAYCLMANHVHILSVPQEEFSLAKTMQKISLTFTQYVNRKYKRTGRLWECRFHSSVIDKDAYLMSVCRYIERNPVRAKIVKTPVEYKWSSARVNTLNEESSLVEPIWKSYINRESYCKFLNETEREDEVELVRKSTFNGKPLGTKEFLNKIEASLNISLKTKLRGRPKKTKK